MFEQIKLAFQNLFRNFWLSVATIIIIILSLFSVSILLSLNTITRQATNLIEKKINISVYFQPSIGQDEIKKVKQNFIKMPEVQKVQYISKETALEQFKQKHQNDELITKSLEELEENPLSDSLIITAKSIEDYPDILAELDNPDYKTLIWNKKFNENYKAIIQRLNQINKNIQLAMLGITLIFIFIAILIIINTIRMGIYTHRGELEIMKLVGATNRFIRGPFLWQGAFYAVIAWVLHLIIFFPVLSAIQPYVSNFLGTQEFNLVGYFYQHFWSIFGWELIGVLILNIFSSNIAMRKYLKV